MENASKALIMAGGILIALLVIGALLLMFNQIGAYQKSNTGSVKESQLAEFNLDFERYADDKGIKGTDIISLVNKIVDFNQKEGVSNSVNYDKKITLQLDLNGFAEKYGVSGKSKIFGKTTLYTINDSNNTLSQAIIKFSNLEKKYTLSTMRKISSNYDNIVKEDKVDKDKIKEITGKNITDITKDDIEKYREYSELKSSTFKPSDTPKYEDGQIVELSFKFIK